MTACEGLMPSDCNNPDCPAHAADRDDLAAILAKHESVGNGCAALAGLVGSKDGDDDE